MTDMQGVLADITKRAEQNNPFSETDYQQDGLWYCGICHAKKQCLVQSPFDEIVLKLPVLCECGKETARKAQEEAEKTDARQEVRMARADSLMDAKLREATFSACIETKPNARALKICKRYADRFDEMFAKNQGLIFYGGVGTGKTYMAACIANQLLDSGITVVITSFVKALQIAHGVGDDAERAFVSNLTRAKLLIIDDLGAERGTDFALEKVYNVIDSRYRAKRPMILTTNLTLPEMQATTDKRYARIYDRILEVCYPVEFTDTSWRKREAARRYEDMKRFVEGDDV